MKNDKTKSLTFARPCTMLMSIEDEALTSCRRIALKFINIPNTPLMEKKMIMGEP